MQDVHIICASEHLYALVEAFEEQFAAQQDEVILLDWGFSCKKGVGYLVLEWAEEVDEAFIEQLTTDGVIDDLCVYTIPCLTDDQMSLLEQAVV